MFGEGSECDFRFPRHIGVAPAVAAFEHFDYAVACHIEIVDQLLQFRVLRLGLLQDGDVAVGVFPQREEILMC